MSTVIFNNLLKRIALRKVYTPNIIIYIHRNNSNILSSQLGNIEIPNVTIPEFVFRSFDQYPNKIAVECAATGKKYTFDDVRNKSNNFNKNLRKKLKLKKGDVIAFILPNVPEFSICMLGALQAGLIVTTTNPLYTPEEIGRQLNDCNAKAVIGLGAQWNSIKAAVQLIKKDIPILTVKLQESEELHIGAININEFIDTYTDIEEVIEPEMDDVALLPYSSGTTGLPKGVQLTHHNIVANMCQVTHEMFMHGVVTSKTEQDIFPAILPWFHIFGLTMTLFVKLHRLSKLVCVPKFTTELFVETLAKHKPNVLYLTPPMISFMSTHPSIKQEFFKPIQSIMSGAAPLGKTDEEKLLSKAGKDFDVMQGYGLTETSPAICVTSPIRKKQLGFIGSIGELIPCTSAKIVPLDGSSESLGPNQSGELLIKGPQVMKGYLNRPKQTEEVFSDGWLRTGDLGYYDHNQMFYITDRLKELIKVKGFQVAPAELEEIIRSHTNIADAAVIGVPDSRSGEIPRAYVVPKLNSKIDAQELQQFVAKKVVDYKQLTGGVVIVDSLPKTASGKVIRKELKQMYEQEIK